MVLKLLAAPILLPIKAVMLVAEEAMTRYYDPKIVLAEFERLRAAHKSGEIDDAGYVEAKAVLNERMKIARERQPGA